MDNAVSPLLLTHRQFTPLLEYRPTHDFGDGRGRIPAYRPVYATGEVGGWVEKDPRIHVAETCYISPESEVSLGKHHKARDYLVILDRVKILGQSKIFGMCQLRGDVIVIGSKISDSQITGRTHIDNCDVRRSLLEVGEYKNRDVFEVSAWASDKYNKTEIPKKRTDKRPPHFRKKAIDLAREESQEQLHDRVDKARESNENQ